MVRTFERRPAPVWQSAVGLGHDLHQRHAGTVEIDQGVLGGLVVYRLAGVLLQMQPLDTDANGFAVDVTSTSPAPTIGRLYWEI